MRCAASRRGVKGLRIAFGETVFFDDVDAEVETAVREAGQVFRALGAQRREHRRTRGRGGDGPSSDARS